MRGSLREWFDTHTSAGYLPKTTRAIFLRLMAPSWGGEDRKQGHVVCLKHTVLWLTHSFGHF